MFIVFLLILLSGCLSSCASTKSSVPPLVEIIKVGESFANKGNVNLSKYATAIEYVPLETKPEAMLPSIKGLKFRKFEENIYVYDRYATLVKPKFPILSFNPEGKFLKEIGVIGRADNEYTHIKDLIINDATREVVIADWTKLIFYTADGEYKRTAEIVNSGHMPTFLNAGCNRFY